MSPKATEPTYSLARIVKKSKPRLRIVLHIPRIASWERYHLTSYAGNSLQILSNNVISVQLCHGLRLPWYRERDRPLRIESDANVGVKTRVNSHCETHSRFWIIGSESPWRKEKELQQANLGESGVRATWHDEIRFDDTWYSTRDTWHLVLDNRHLAFALRTRRFLQKSSASKVYKTMLSDTSARSGGRNANPIDDRSSHLPPPGLPIHVLVRIVGSRTNKLNILDRLIPYLVRHS